MQTPKSRVYVQTDSESRVLRLEGEYSLPADSNDKSLHLSERLYSVYKHTSPSGKVYIGITSMKPKERWAAGYKCCKAFQAAIEKYGWENIKSEILFTGLTRDEACSKEIELIAFYNSTNSKYGYNISGGGKAPLLGLPVSQATREKLSKASKEVWQNKEYHDAHSGKNAYWYGKHHSAESLQKIKDHHPDQSGVNHPMYGKKHTDESKKKMSIAIKGKHLRGENCHAKPVVQLALDGTYLATYLCMEDAAEATHSHASNIRKVITGERNQAGGFKWQYKEVYENARNAEKQGLCSA